MITCKQCGNEPEDCSCGDSEYAEFVARHNLPTDDALDVTEAKCPPPDHAEKCRRLAQELADAERLLYRLANGDRHAAEILEYMTSTLSGLPNILRWDISKVLANVLG